MLRVAKEVKKGYSLRNLPKPWLKPKQEQPPKAILKATILGNIYNNDISLRVEME